MFDEPIKTLEQAKDFFMQFNGSPYDMVRDFPQRFDEYKSFNISKETQRRWREELLEKYFNNLKESADASRLWADHAEMERLFVDLKSDAALKTMLKATEYLKDKVPMKDRVMVAETINGRTARSVRGGLIYMAYDLHNKTAAKAFAELSLHFSTYDGRDQYSINRSQSAAQLCNEIKRELRL